MPDKLREFLESLTREEAEKIFDYLDSNPNADLEMIAVVAPIADIQ